MRIVSLQRLTILINHEYRAWRLSEVHSVLCHTHAAAWESVGIALREIRCLKMYVILVSLQLSAPQASKVYIHFAVGIVLERAHVNAVASCYRGWLWYEWACGVVGDGNAPVEDIGAVFHWEVHDVSLHLLAVPHSGGLFLGVCRHLVLVLLHITVP